VAEAMRIGSPEQSGTPFEKPWPRAAWPDIPTRFLQGRDDRFLPLEFQRRVVAERIGIEADEMPGGHAVALSRPVELAERLDAYRR
jgi:pimeloyl-ACP methyl ester carboxylesterase